MTNKLYVGGLSIGTGDQELKTLFERAGTVQSANVVTQRDSGLSKGFGFVEMSSEAEIQRAIADLNGMMVGERRIRVEEARPRTLGRDSVPAAAPIAPVAVVDGGN